MKDNLNINIDLPRTIKVAENILYRSRIYDGLYENKSDEKLGDGVFGIVYKVESTSLPKKNFALKKLKKKITAKESFVNSVEFREAKILFETSCDQIVKYVDCFFDDSDYFYLITEFCEGGNLRRQIEDKKRSSSKFDYETITHWTKEIVLGLQFLHSHKIVHRDIKPANIFLKKGCIKLGDLGEAKQIIGTTANTYTGTQAYMSPEMHKKYFVRTVVINEKTDVWSAGVTLFELVTLRLPFNSNIKEIQFAIWEFPVPFHMLPEETPHHLKLLIQKMLRKNPADRISSRETKDMFEFAESIYKTTKIENTESFQELTKKGYHLTNMGKYHEAIEKFDKAIYINPFYALAFNGKGSCLEKIERYQEAIECFEKAIQINANDSFAFNNKGICFFKMNKYQEAIESYDKAIKINPNYALAYYNKGYCLANMNKYHEAIDCYDKAIGINPNLLVAVKNREIVLKKLKN